MTDDQLTDQQDLEGSSQSESGDGYEQNPEQEPDGQSYADQIDTEATEAQGTQPEVPAQQATPQPAPQPQAEAAARIHPGTVSPFAQGVITQQRREQLEQVFLPEQLDAIIALSSDIAQMQIRAFEQNQDIAVDLGVPAQYMRDVKAYSDRVPEAMRGSKEGAQAAILLAMHDRAAQGGNLIDEMQRFVEAARPAPAIPAKSAPQPPRELAAAARVTRSTVSGSAVQPPRTTNGARNRDPLYAHFPFIKAED